MKFNRLATMAIIFLMTLVLLTGCGKDSPEGIWRITDHTAIGDGDVENNNGVIITYEFKEGGEFIFGLIIGEAAEYISGAWETDGDTMSITMDGDTVEYKYEIKDDVLTLTETDSDEPAKLRLERY